MKHMNVINILILIIIYCFEINAYDAKIFEDHVFTKSLHVGISSSNIWLNYKKGKTEISDLCDEHFQLYTDSLKNYTTWAYQMFDSSTKIPESIFSGAMTHLGNFDQCLAVIAYYTNQTKAFNGQYCGTKIKIIETNRNFSLSLQIATCLPSTCTPVEIQTLLQDFILLPIDQVIVEINPQNCYVEGDKPNLDVTSWIMICIYVFLTLAVLLLSLFDFLNITSGNITVDSIFKAFSLVRNIHNLVGTKHSNGSIRFMHGMRALCTLYIILAHRYALQTLLPMINVNQFYQMIDEVYMQIILNAMPTVDTFLFMSGLLVSLLLFKDLNQDNRFHPIKYYLYRYLRLTTSYAAVIAFFSTIRGYIGYGPLWRQVIGSQTQACKDTWWTGLLYIDNFVQFKKYADNYQPSTCMGQGWYLTVDMQLAWIAPLIILPLYYWPKYTSKFLILIILASCFAPFTSAYLNNFFMVTNIFDNPAHNFKYKHSIYTIFYMRATPYLMGICLAYFIYKKQKNTLRLPKSLVLCGWTASTAIALTVIFSPAIMYQSGYEYDRVASAFYVGFHKLAWSFVIGWIILTCHYGYGGPVNLVLSWRGWLPLSRLSYCMFLLHLYFMYIDLYSIRIPIYFNHFSNLQKYCGDIIFTVVSSFILHLIIEAPTLGLLRTFIKPQKKILAKQ